jgi:uncharacterized membrane protein YjfL (UPF0719 family)
MSNSAFIGVVAIAGIALIFGLLKFWKSRVFKKTIPENGEQAWAIFIAGHIITFALIFTNSFQNLISLKSMIQQSSDDVYVLLQYFGIFVFIIVMAYAFISAIANVILRLVSTDVVGAFYEIKENKIVSAIIIAAMLIGFALITGDLLDDVFNELIPEREGPRWF